MDRRAISHPAIGVAIGATVTKLVSRLIKP
jgi:hypothetical protein